MDEEHAGSDTPPESPRWVTVSPERFPRWIDGFERRHGTTGLSTTAYGLRAHGQDGAVAECHVPFVRMWALAAGRAAPAALPSLAAEHAGAERTVGVLLVRAGGHGAGIFDGDSLVDSKVGSRLVGGRHKAGGQSQQRFARHREQQRTQAFSAAAEVAARILVPRAADLDALVLGGDRRAVDRVLDDRRLQQLRSVPREQRFLTVPDPRLQVLRGTPQLFRAVRIRIVPAGGPAEADSAAADL